MTSRRIGAALAVLSVSASGTETTMMANPIRRVVNLLQKMQKKVIAEGDVDQELFDKYMCYCTTGEKDLQDSIKDAETKMPQATAMLEEAEAKKEQLNADLKSHKAERADAQNALNKATAIREKEAATFANEESETKANIKAAGKAYTAISDGMGGAFLQTPAAATLRKLAGNVDLSGEDHDTLLAFLSQEESGSSDGPAGSGEILGIIGQMKETMEKTLKEMQKDEGEAKAAFASLSAAKEKEIKISTKMIEDKTAREGQVGIDIVTLKEDIEDTSATYAEDKDFLKDLAKNCKQKQADYAVVQKTRGEELVALGDTIKILNNDEALDLFKKNLPSPSLLQLKVQAKEVRSRALSVLRGESKGRALAADPRLDFLVLAIRGKKFSFDKVIGMIDSMVKVLNEEQSDDDDKKAYCEQKIDLAEDEQKTLDLSVADLGKTIEETKSSIETLNKEVAALVKGIKALDASIAEATENRKAENAEYKKTVAGNAAAKELLKMASKRMAKFYTPGAAAASSAASAASFVQVRLRTRRSSDDAPPPPPPEAVGAYKQKGEESAGVMQMINLLITDIDKEMAEVEAEEKDSQADYEKYVSDSAKKRTLDAKALEEKESTMAESGALLEKSTHEKKSKTMEAYANSKVVRDLHAECDWLLSNYDVRKKARVGELDSLTKAKAILSGADYSFVQAGSRHRRLLRGL